MTLVVKNPSANAGDLRDLGSILVLGRSPGGGQGNPLQYSCLENPIGRGHCHPSKNQTACMHVSHFNGVQLCVTLWTVSSQAPLSMGFSRQEYWSGLPCPPPGDLPAPGIELVSLVSPALTGGFFITSTTWEA